MRELLVLLRPNCERLPAADSTPVGGGIHGWRLMNREEYNDGTPCVLGFTVSVDAMMTPMRILCAGEDELMRVRYVSPLRWMGSLFGCFFCCIAERAIKPCRSSRSIPVR